MYYCLRIIEGETISKNVKTRSLAFCTKNYIQGQHRALLKKYFIFKVNFLEFVTFTFASADFLSCSSLFARSCSILNSSANLMASTIAFLDFSSAFLIKETLITEVASCCYILIKKQSKAFPQKFNQKPQTLFLLNFSHKKLHFEPSLIYLCGVGFIN